MESLYEQMVSFFRDDHWPYLEVDESVLQMNFQGQNGRWTCYAQSRMDVGQVVMYSVCPMTVPEGLRTAVAEFITRANYGLIIGNFELDYDDGEVRYKTSLDAENAPLSHELMQPLVYANVWTMDRYLPGLMAVIYGSTSPRDAVALAEQTEAAE
jgi:hypothetical protein